MSSAEDMRRRNRAVATAAVGIVAVMGGLVAVSPIFYSALSSYIGYGGALQTGKTRRRLSDAGIDRTIDVRFATNIYSSLDVDFEAEKRSVTVNIGRPQKLYFDVTNKGSVPLVMRIAFDVTPAWAAPYFFRSVRSFHSVERLAAGESAHVPVVFYVDRRILKDKLAARVGAITLSYTLLRQRGMSGGASAAVGDLRARSEALSARLLKDGAATFANDSPPD